MNTVSTLGAVLTAVGILGYVAGVLSSYPGRSFSLTALMFGLTLVALARSSGGDGT